MLLAIVSHNCITQNFSYFMQGHSVPLELGVTANALYGRVCLYFIACPDHSHGKSAFFFAKVILLF